MLFLRNLDRDERDCLYFHCAFSLIVVVFLLAPLSYSLGWKIFLLLVLYNLAVPVFGQYLGHPGWVNIWLFVFPLSIFQILPDLFLSTVLGSLVFPNTGFPFIGTVPAYMGLMWSLPLFGIVYVATRLRSRLEAGKIYAIVALLALVVLGASEATLWMLPVWHAAPQILAPLHIAVYVIIAEVILGCATWYAFRSVENQGWAARIVAAFTVMLVYTGALALSYLLIERLLRA
ncbi:MAG: hypothetical protein K8S54_15120 [Spirochaetia bacterium]|nr:hypothetical protein [Spirochaetia bacterium]